MNGGGLPRSGGDGTEGGRLGLTESNVSVSLLNSNCVSYPPTQKVANMQHIDVLPNRVYKCRIGTMQLE
jgi:hypothetical protein